MSSEPKCKCFILLTAGAFGDPEKYNVCLLNGLPAQYVVSLFLPCEAQFFFVSFFFFLLHMYVKRSCGDQTKSKWQGFRDTI